MYVCVSKFTILNISDIARYHLIATNCGIQNTTTLQQALTSKLQPQQQKPERHTTYYLHIAHTTTFNTS